jgi:L,D-transpeptidase ErfK/SrfK
MTAHRSRSARSARVAAACLALAAALGCSMLSGPKPPPPHPLENPPPSADLVGRLSFHEVRAEETFVDLAPAFGVGYLELLAANWRMDPWLPPVGARIVVPGAHLLPSGPREGIVVNTGDLRLYWFGSGEPRSYPIGVAKSGFATPKGATKVVRKKENPIWYPTAAHRRDDPTLASAVPPGPDNRLGAFALYLGWPSYLIHGTNEPRGVGRHTSRGCIRMYPEHIAELFASVPVGTPVRVVHEPVKLGWVGGELYLEVHPDAKRALLLDETGSFEHEPAPDVREAVNRAAGRHAARVDWERVRRASYASAGVPVRITRPALPLTVPAGR